MEKVLAGRYQLEAEIARGAIGTVWRAHDLTTGEPVAVKVLLPDTAQDPDVVKGLLDEAEILAQLNHPSIVGARDFVANGLHALVMDLVEGVDVRQRLRDQGPLRSSEVAGIGAQIADALASVHAAGILHGDVKPGNIMVPANGGPAKLGDFGVARRVQLPDTVTHATPEYVAPEVVEGIKPTPASDVYSLGMVLYEMVCGRSPYRGGSVTEVIERHAGCAPVQPAGMPDELWELVRHCVELNPALRPSAEQVAARLRTLAPTLVGRPAAAMLPEYAVTYRPRLMDPAAEPLSPAAPGAVAPTSPGPVSATPASVAPFSAAPSSAMPSSAMPSWAMPSSAVPSSAVPASVAPGSMPAPVSPAAANAMPDSPAPAGPQGDAGESVLALFDKPGEEPTRVVGGAAVPPERPADNRPKTLLFAGIAAALLLFLAAGAGVLIWSSMDGPATVATQDPTPTERGPDKPATSPEPTPGGSTSPTPDSSPSTQPPKPPPGGGTDGGTDGDGGGDNRFND
ncbi:MAG: protein kinase domain-containing protein, partial [Micromonosporaceae bacterium]